MFKAKLLLALASAMSLQGATLSPFDGETLAGNKVSLPSAIQGGMAVLVVGFSKDSQKQTERWAKRIRTEFPALECWSVADLEELPRLLRGIVVRAIRGSVPKAQHGRFALVFKGGKALRQAAGYSSGDDAYLMVVNPEGAIGCQLHGPVTEAAITELRRCYQ